MAGEVTAVSGTSLTVTPPSGVAAPSPMSDPTARRWLAAVARALTLALPAPAAAEAGGARPSRDLVTPREFADALNSAAAVGDDFQQKLATGQVEPEKWTHGSSEQRQRWLNTGYEKGKVSACDTFSGSI